MPVFAYRGLGADGRSVNGVVDADSARTARGKLRASGIFPTDLNEESNAAERSAAKREWLPSLWGGKSRRPALVSLRRRCARWLGPGWHWAVGSTAPEIQCARPRPHRSP